MAYNRRSGGGGYGGGNSGNYGNSFGQNGGNFGGSGGGGNFNGGGGGGRFNNYNNYGRNPKMSPWESGVSPGGGMMPNVHPNQMALASDLLSKLLAPNQGGYGGGQNWGPNPGMMRRQESFKNQNRRRPDNRNRRPPPKKDDKKKDSKPEADKNDQSKQTNGVKKDSAEQEHVDYDGIPTAVLFCHVCQKHMWDGASFEKHVRGRPHELMMTYLDEGYKMHVELMRHQIKAAENQREIDLERMQAQNKGKVKPLFRNYCPMCNINFYGPLTGHRKSDRHRKLKQFLHPECKMCDTLFHTRLEWDDHKLSADHLRKVGEQRRQFNPDLKDDEFELLDVIVIEDDEQSEEIPVVSKSDMLQDQEIKDEIDDDEKDEQVTAEVSEGSLKMEVDTESAVNKEKGVDKMEANDDTKEVTENDQEVPDGTKEVTDDSKENTQIKKEKDEKYNPANVVGRELVVKTGGFVCRICAVFMKNDEEAELHCQTATHYLNLTSITKLHAKINNRKRKMKEEKKESGDKEDEKPEENEGEQPVKRARLDETEPEETILEETKPEETNTVAEQNGTAEELVTEDKAAEDNDVQETKVEDTTTNNLIDDEKMEVGEPEPVVEPEPVKAKTTPTRGRGRGARGVTRRGRSR